MGTILVRLSVTFKGDLQIKERFLTDAERKPRIRKNNILKFCIRYLVMLCHIVALFMFNLYTLILVPKKHQRQKQVLVDS